MARRDHLRVNRHDAVAPRRKQGGGARTKPQPGRDKKQFAKDQLKRFDNLGEKHQDRRRRFGQYIDPSLIFEIKTNQKISMSALDGALRGIGARILAAPTGGEGTWIVFADESARDGFADRLEKYATQDSYKFLDAIETFADINPQDKIGPRLRALANGPDATIVLDVELWGMPPTQRRKVINAVASMSDDQGGRLYDVLERSTFTLLRVHAPHRFVNDLIELPEVAAVDLPFAAPGFVRVDVPARDLDFGGPPPDDAPAVLVIDSGVVAGHPALINCVLDERSFLPDVDDPADDTGHGTEVAGIAAYGSVPAALDSGAFEPTHWLLSAKVMKDDGNGGSTFDDTKLLANQIIDAVRWAAERAPELRAVNLSLGDEADLMYYGRRQFPLAEVVDELAREFGVVFTISTGNYQWTEGDEYPSYLADETERAKIMNPASAVLALTTGSYYRAVDSTNGAAVQQNLFGEAAAFIDQPSPFTRVGPGVTEIIKPDLVAFGGQGFASDGPGTGEKDVHVLNWKYIDEGRLFTISSGTSLAAPYVAFLIAQTAIAHPGVSAVMLRALALASARIPQTRPVPYDTFSVSGSTDEARKLLNTYGWGIPDGERSAFSADDRVVLMAESEIDIDGLHVYPLAVPPEFFESAGTRTIRVALAHSPPVNRNRVHYLGHTLEFAVFHGVNAQDVLDAWAEREPSTDDEEEEEEDDTPDLLKGKNVNLKPGISTIKKGANQVGARILKNKSSWDSSKPLVVAIRSRNRWLPEEASPERYALVVELEQEGTVDLHARVQVVNEVSVEAVVRQDLRT